MGMMNRAKTRWKHVKRLNLKRQAKTKAYYGCTVRNWQQFL